MCTRKWENVWYIQYIYISSERGETIVYLHHVYDLVLCISERKKLYYTYSVVLIQTLCIWNKKTVSYLQCVMIQTLCIRKRYWCRLCASERGKLYHTYSVFMIQNLCIRNRKTVSYLQYVQYLLILCVWKDGICIILTWSEHFGNGK